MITSPEMWTIQSTDELTELDQKPLSSKSYKDVRVYEINQNNTFIGTVEIPRYKIAKLENGESITVNGEDFYEPHPWAGNWDNFLPS